MAELGAPEVAKPRCNTELAKGLLVSERLRQLLNRPVWSERAGRTPASFVAPDRNVAEVLIREGLVIPYKPAPRLTASAPRIKLKKGRRLWRSILVLRRVGKGEGRVLPDRVLRTYPARR